MARDSKKRAADSASQTATLSQRAKRGGPPNPVPVNERLMSLKHAGEYMGKDRSTVLRYMSRGYNGHKLLGVRVGKTWKTSRQAIDLFIEAIQTRPEAEMAECLKQQLRDEGLID